MQSFSQKRAIRQNWEMVHAMSGAFAAFAGLFNVITLGYVGTYALYLSEGKTPKACDVLAFHWAVNGAAFGVAFAFACLGIMLFANVKRA